ncbi:unnamed protein product [Medioppia subpectinata]|uniref:Protein Wnt n=1 Tax=Medioppia subpectinata TaxID=1979941 RepID=A0A7R9KKM3_9ACAR|nr:unnamed protein product [Medioppia subpectinata]CAG2104975.1 unnamed protein product [Medioppia subpectinata]
MRFAQNPTLYGLDYYFKSPMLPILIVLAIMFVGICVALNLFSRALKAKDRMRAITKIMFERQRHVSNEMRRECKCHGMSGSFDGASRVLVSNDYRGLTRKKYKKVQLKPYETGYKSPTRKDLIYFEESPDFCVTNQKFGVLGTKGRVCNDTSIGVEGCDLLCCGRGYKTEIREELERCNCTFHWCCQVKCNICKARKTVHTSHLSLISILSSTRVLMTIALVLSNKTCVEIPFT